MLDFGSFELQQDDRGSLDVRLEEVHRAVVVVIEGGLHEREVLGGEVPMRISRRGPGLVELGGVGQPHADIQQDLVAARLDQPTIID
jgi:hypothetical protein